MPNFSMYSSVIGRPEAPGRFICGGPFLPIAVCSGWSRACMSMATHLTCFSTNHLPASTPVPQEYW